MTVLPTIFLSHGAPDLPIRTGAAPDFLRSLRHMISLPEAILVVSAHWHADRPLVSSANQPKTIHDFSGFPETLYQLHYAAPGAPDLADRVVTLLTQAGIASGLHPSRGFDHGAWTPLILAYPEATIPVTQLSINYARDPQYHWHVGQALASLRHEGVLVIGSGSATHNLYAFAREYQASPPAWVQQFDDWLAATIAQRQWDALLHYRHHAPYAQENHPTDEHLLPLFVALGAAGANPQGTPLHRSYTYGAFSMAAYAFQS